MASRSARLGLGRRAVDLVGQHHIRKQRALDEAKDPPARGMVLFQHVGPGDIRGHEVGRELDPLVPQVEDLGERAHQQGLGHAGHAHQQGVAAAEDGHQHLFDHLVLPNNDP